MQCRIGITSARKGAELSTALEHRGAEVTWAPMLTTDRDAALAMLSSEITSALDAKPDWVLASTGTGVSQWLQAADRTGQGEALRSMLRSTRVVSRGAKALGALRAEGIDADFVSPVGTDEDAADWLTGHAAPGQTLVVQLDGTATLDVYRSLADHGLRVVTVAPYRTSLPEQPAPAHALIRRIVNGDIDIVVCTSPPAARNLGLLARQIGLGTALVTALSERTAVAAVGHVTATALESQAIPVATMPLRPRTGALIRAIEAWAARGAERSGRHDRGIRLLPSAGVATVHGQSLVFGRIEFRLLCTLVRRPGVACPLEVLVREGWGHATPSTATALKHQISRIRQKLGPAATAITTVRGVGYRYDPARLPTKA